MNLLSILMLILARSGYSLDCDELRALGSFDSSFHSSSFPRDFSRTAPGEHTGNELHAVLGRRFVFSFEGWEQAPADSLDGGAREH